MLRLKHLGVRRGALPSAFIISLIKNILFIIYHANEILCAILSQTTLVYQQLLLALTKKFIVGIDKHI